jgi:hypothetical protein
MLQCGVVSDIGGIMSLKQIPILIDVAGRPIRDQLQVRSRWPRLAFSAAIPFVIDGPGAQGLPQIAGLG